MLRSGGRRLHRLRTKPEHAVAQQIRVLYEQAIGRPPEEEGLLHYAQQLKSGRSAVEIALELGRSPEGLAHAARTRGLYLDIRTDPEFISDLYSEVLGRDADPSGRAWLEGLLKAGMSRQSVATILATSDESLNRQLAERTYIRDLRELRPESFRQVVTTDGASVDVFHVSSPEDYDWLENAILDFGYYEKPGIWSLVIDDDKRRMAQILSAFRPHRALELGCASGAVLKCLDTLGFFGEGLEISTMAIQRADRDIRPRIHRGDLLEANLNEEYDLVYALDVFEHFNPNRLSAYLHRIAKLTTPGGFLFVNSPAFGRDAVWGEIFPLYIPSWRADVSAGRPFRDLHVDEDGYPQHGHLIWASPDWWTEQFERAGFRREAVIERALHATYDNDFEREALARKAFFVFSYKASADRIATVATEAAKAPGARSAAELPMQRGALGPLVSR
jgi:2-polyprenyl-3-methyl-5-hydroxy-6-metoxy-1,4-benzoquinol methylase